MILQAEIERELNTGFDYTGSFCPFRFFAVPQPGSFFLASTYFHPIADAESVVRLVRQLVESYLQPNAPDSSPNMEIYPEPHDRLSQQSPGTFANKLLSIPSLVSNMRQSCRPSFRDPNDLANHFTFFK